MSYKDFFENNKSPTKREINTDDLNFIGNDPGATKFGNFINYYSFHSVGQRISNLNPEMFPVFEPNQTIVCLDIGCNTGELTIALHSYLKKVFPNCNVKILAIDIDSKLIKKAQKSCSNCDIIYQTEDIMDADSGKSITNYLHSHGRNDFDIVFCFSVTLWIHINNGDEGLFKLINLLKSISRSIVVEPQPWKCYRNAQRRMKRSGSGFPFYDALKIRSNVDSVIEQKISENTHKKVFESPNSKWNRKVQSFHRISDT